MSDIPLSKSGRPALPSLRNSAGPASPLPDRQPARTGANPDPGQSAVTASSLNSRAGDLNILMDSMAQGMKTIERADSGLAAIIRNLEAMQALLRTAGIIDDQALSTSYNGLLSQLDTLVEGADLDGVNLLRGDNLTIAFNDTGSASIEVQTKNGMAIDAANLGLGGPITTTELTDASSISNRLAALGTAIEAVRAQSSAFGSNLSVVQSRSDFTRSMIATLQVGAAKLSLADSNEEAANLLALQTRQSLSALNVSVATAADQSVLQLLR